MKVNVQDSDYSGLRVGHNELAPSTGTVLLMHLNGDTTDYSGYGHHGTRVYGPDWISTATWKSSGVTEQILEFDDTYDQFHSWSFGNLATSYAHCFQKLRNRLL